MSSATAPSRAQWPLALSSLGLWLFAFCLIWLLGHDPGVLGEDNTVTEAITRVTFHWWLNIARGAALTSAALLLFRQAWRSTVSRAADATALFAAVTALVFELLAWAPALPERFTPKPGSPLWPELLSAPLLTCVAALFVYLAVLPDLKLGSALSLGWRGAGRHWPHWRRARELLAALLIAVCLTPKLASAAQAGLAVVVLVVLATTWESLSSLGKLLLAASLATTLGHALAALQQGALPHGTLTLAGLACTCAVPQLLWLKAVRASDVAMALISVIVAAGVWLEQFVATLLPQQRSELPSSWASWQPTWVDVGLALGSVGLFCFGVVLFFRALPARERDTA